MHLKPTEEISVMRNIRKVYFPLMWVDETATIDDPSADIFKSMATIPLLLLDIFSLGFGLGLGSFGLLVSVIFFTWNYYTRRKSHKVNHKLK